MIQDCWSKGCENGYVHPLRVYPLKRASLGNSESKLIIKKAEEKTDNALLMRKIPKNFDEPPDHVHGSGMTTSSLPFVRKGLSELHQIKGYIEKPVLQKMVARVQFTPKKNLKISVLSPHLLTGKEMHQTQNLV